MAIVDNKGGLIEKLIVVNRVSKAVKGGRRMSFAAMVVVGDGNGKAGYGLGKANDVAEAIRKGTEAAKKGMRQFQLKRTTLPHESVGKFKKACVLLKPAAPGTGIKAGGPVRAVMEAVGVHDVITKSKGSSNLLNVVQATFAGLAGIYDARLLVQLRDRDSLAQLWGK